MVKIKEDRTEQLLTNVKPSLKQIVLDFAEDNGELSESKAVEILIIRGLKLPSPYKEIAKHFAEWELPQDGRIPKTAEGYAEYKEIVDEATPTDESIYYTNGYGFDEKTGHLFIAVYETNDEGWGELAEPTPDQREGIIMGTVEEWANDGDYVIEGVPMYIEDKNGKKIPNQEFVEYLKIDVEGEKLSDLMKIRSYASRCCIFKIIILRSDSDIKTNGLPFDCKFSL
ncbi:hypothetical protein V3595_00085 [Bacillus sp. CFBP9009]